jgi:hypothetical protein
MNPEQRMATVNMLPRPLAILPPLLPDVHSAAKFRVAPTSRKRTRSYVQQDVWLKHWSIQKSAEDRNFQKVSFVSERSAYHL